MSFKLLSLQLKTQNLKLSTGAKRLTTNHSKSLFPHSSRLCRKNRSVIRWEPNLELCFPMSTLSLFKWWHFLPDVIMLNVRWYCRYCLSYRNLEQRQLGKSIFLPSRRQQLLRSPPEMRVRRRNYSPADTRSFAATSWCL